MLPFQYVQGLELPIFTTILLPLFTAACNVVALLAAVPFFRDTKLPVKILPAVTPSLEKE